MNTTSLLDELNTQNSLMSYFLSHLVMYRLSLSFESPVHALWHTELLQSAQNPSLRFSNEQSSNYVLLHTELHDLISRLKDENQSLSNEILEHITSASDLQLTDDVDNTLSAVVDFNEKSRELIDTARKILDDNQDEVQEQMTKISKFYLDLWIDLREKVLIKLQESDERMRGVYDKYLIECDEVIDTIRAFINPPTKVESEATTL